MTVRERIRQVQVTLRDTEMTPALARDSLVALTALLGHCADELRAADVDYRKVLLTCLEQEEHANRAKLRADTSPEYMRFSEARDTRDLVKQMIVTCRAYLRSLDTEMQLSK